MFNLTKLKAFDISEDTNIKPENDTKPNSSQLLLSYLDESSENENSKVGEIFITEFIHVINSNTFIFYYAHFYITL